MSVLALLLAVAVSSASLDYNSTDTDPVLSVDIGSILPFFGPVDFDNDNDIFDEAMKPLESAGNSSHNAAPQEDTYSITFMEIISFSDDDTDNVPDMKIPGFPFIFENIEMLDDFGILDLSNKKLTGDELAAQLQSRDLVGKPVTSLVLSNSRVEGLTANNLQIVEHTLRDLKMDNCSVSLDALGKLSNLRFLNLSNTGLSTFRWFPKMQFSLLVLDLSHNKLPEVNIELSILSSLRELYLSHNRITRIEEPSALDMLQSLEVLSLTMNSLNKVIITKLENLQKVDLDRNYLIKCGEDARLPNYRLSVKLASNPWRCDCGLLAARDNYNVLDIDQLQCANRGSYSVCDDCTRYFLPLQDGRLVGNLTKDSIEYLGCTGIGDQYYLVRNALGQLKRDEPEKLAKLGVLMVASLMLFIAAIYMCRRSCSSRKFNRQTWLKVQQIPYLHIDKLKPQEVPYVKIDAPNDIKA